MRHTGPAFDRQRPVLANELARDADFRTDWEWGESFHSQSFVRKVDQSGP